MKQKTRNRIVALLVVAVFIGVILFWYFQIKKPHDVAAAEFHTAAATVIEKNKELDQAIAELQVLLDTKEEPFDDTVLTNARMAIAESDSAKVVIPELPKHTAEIISATDDLKQTIDYTAYIEQLKDAKQALETSIQQLKQLTNPSEAFIMERLSTVDTVSELQAVTEDNDPNGNLNKPGGYTATVYFSSPLVNPQDVYGASVIEKGTDGGGCVEAYASVADAKKRDLYLSTFDGATAMNSGSHAVYGTLVIRTSSRLTATLQKKTEQSVLDALLRVE
ncbi:hypothetical protein [Agathobaculum sp.]|uniref:hypothetical protein n=1 Tax=Agathobaculum sp. TaxID=2048138 RepID=UPI002A8001F3|nr:hypothetical protein [Agathobaculum sp.]MDY3618467.1 hypothetical protein [Agathobaculum sp.]